MTAVRVFDPAMCCSTGICGPSVDPQLVRFSADLDWLQSQGVSVERFNLAQQPGAFASDPAVRAALHDRGEASLPVVQVNGDIKSSGVYPSRAELAAWAGLAKPSARSSIRLTPIASACCSTSSDTTAEGTSGREKCC